MEPNLDNLERKIEQVIAYCNELRSNNSMLQEKLHTCVVENGELRQRLQQISARIENLLSKLPDQSSHE